VVERTDDQLEHRQIRLEDASDPMRCNGSLDVPQAPSGAEALEHIGVRLLSELLSVHVPILS
jgi:hypothetical protein